MRLLILDDCPTTCLHLKGLLSQVGYTDTLTATSFTDAMRILTDVHKAGVGVDLILMDVELPDTDGIAATSDHQGPERIRGHPDHHGHGADRRGHL